jgi:hypothetical protein
MDAADRPRICKGAAAIIGRQICKVVGVLGRGIDRPEWHWLPGAAERWWRGREHDPLHGPPEYNPPVPPARGERCAARHVRDYGVVVTDWLNCAAGGDVLNGVGCGVEPPFGGLVLGLRAALAGAACWIARHCSLFDPRRRRGQILREVPRPDTDRRITARSESHPIIFDGGEALAEHPASAGLTPQHRSSPFRDYGIVAVQQKHMGQFLAHLILLDEGIWYVWMRAFRRCRWHNLH